MAKWQNIRDFFQILNLGKVKKIFFVLSLFFIFVAMFFETLSFSLLFPLFKRLIEGKEFDTWKNIPIIGNIFSSDSISERLIQEVIYDLSCGRTVLIIAHRLSTVIHADNIIVLENGTIAESGRLQDPVNKRAKFYEYWQAQKF